MTLSFLLLPQQVTANEATQTHIKNSKIFNPTQPQNPKTPWEVIET
jgi:hypothetical protein